MKKILIIMFENILHFRDFKISNKISPAWFLKTKPKLHLFFIFLTCLFSSTTILAQNTTSWIDTTGGNWNDPTKWSNGVPGPNSDVVITVKGNFSVDLQSDVTIKSLLLETAPGEHKH